MKKSFWGYHIAQTDDLIDSLQCKNDLLIKKVSDLSLKLNSTSGGTSSEQTSNSMMRDIEFLREEISRLEKSNHACEEKYESQIASLKKENQILSKRFSQAGASSENRINSTDSVGVHFDRLYKDIENLKMQTAFEMVRNVDEFTASVDAAKEQIQISMADLKQQYNDTIKIIFSLTDSLYEDLKTVEYISQLIEKQYMTLDTSDSGISESRDKIFPFTADIHRQYDRAVEIISALVNKIYDDTSSLESAYQSIDGMMRGSTGITLELKDKIRVFVDRNITPENPGPATKSGVMAHGTDSSPASGNGFKPASGNASKTTEFAIDNFNISSNVKPSDILGG